MMENLSTITVIARTTVAAVYRTAQIVASLPNMAYNNKASPQTHTRIFVIIYSCAVCWKCSISDF